MKKFLFLVMVMFSFLFANAQPTPSFWSNWSVGGNVILTKEIKNTTWNFGQGTNVGFGLTAHKQLTAHWGVRLIADVPGVFTSDTLKYDRYGKGMIGFDYRFNNGIYLFADGGGAMLFDGNPLLKLAADLGVGYIYDLNEHNSLFAELGADVVASFPSTWENTNVYLKLGYRYNFGLTKADKEILEQWTILQSTKAAANTENDSIVDYHKRICPDTTFAHLQRIDALQHDNENLLQEIKLKDSIIFRLDSILDNMKENSDNFYAMPFSIEFDNDSYTVRQDQYEKLKQIAYLMNSDTTINYNICGYCDHTGSAEYNQKLSVKRAEEVKRLLVNRCGVKEEQLTTSGKGKDVAFGDIKSPINRRVSFFRQF